MEALYHIYDIYSCITLVSERTGKMETVLSDFFIFIDRETINKRLEKSENALNENQELDFLVINYFNLLKTKFQYLQNLPGPRVLYGTNTNKGFADFPSTDAICKSKKLIIYLILFNSFFLLSNN